MKEIEIMKYSAYDDSLPIKLLEQAFQMQVDKSSKLTKQVVYDLMKSNKANVSFPIEGKEKMRLVVDGSDNFIKDYQDGVIKLAREKGHVVAQIKENGKYGKKLPIKEEKYFDGPTSLEVMNACQLQNIADSLQELSDQLLAIDENIKEVLKGQQNDRLGFYYSGVSLYIEANQVSNLDLRNQLISQSLKALNDAKYQLILSVQSDINYLIRREYESNKKQKFNLLNEKINSINKAFCAIHQSSLMKAGIYCQYGEIDAMICVFNEYASFIKNTIEPNAKLLAQCDVHDTGKIDGTWSKRVLLLKNMTASINHLKLSDNVMYIETKGNGKNESN